MTGRIPSKKNVFDFFVFDFFYIVFSQKNNEKHLLFLLSFSLQNDRAPVVLHPGNHLLCLLERRWNDLEASGFRDGRRKRVDEVSPRLEKGKGHSSFSFFFFSFSSSPSPSPFPSAPPPRELVLPLDRRQERPVVPPGPVFGGARGVLEQAPHALGGTLANAFSVAATAAAAAALVAERPQEARVVEPPPLRQGLGVAAELEVSEGIVCFFVLLLLLFFV